MILNYLIKYNGITKINKTELNIAKQIKQK